MTNTEKRTAVLNCAINVAKMAELSKQLAFLAKETVERLAELEKEIDKPYVVEVKKDD